MKRAALFALVVGCEAAREPAKQPAPDTTWITSAKLDEDVQELVLRAYEEDVAFPFRVRRGGEETVVRLKAPMLGSVVGDPAVESVRCETASPEPPPDDAWREKVDPDVRTVAATKGTCFTAVTIAFARDATPEDRTKLEALGFLVKGFDGRGAIGWAPVRSIATIAALELVAHVQ